MKAVLTNIKEFSGADIIHMPRKEVRPEKPKMNYALPTIGDVIVYNVRVPFCDRRTTLKKEMRGCMQVTGIYKSVVVGKSYQLLAGKKEPLTFGTSLQINDFRVGNIVYVKLVEPVYNNMFLYEDWMLDDQQNEKLMIEQLHPEIREKIIFDSSLVYLEKCSK